ncbi:hypothetical protein EHS25_003547 [Saitozyma podzolica]|uniref:Uncharacterized protein n=1 Tax=Saitozyma podzolica TaxID=1890683 RepID=A0A427Y7K1_9TREE|nr:hypothetical protein EHS25_003547 [Saitozyma podzolica]
MNPPPIPSRQGLTSLPRRAPSAASTTPPTTSTSTSKLPSIPDFLPPATNPSTSYPGSTLDLSRESSVPFPRPSQWIPRARVPLGARPLPPSISPSVPLRSIHTDDPTQSPSSLLSSDFQGSQSQSQSHHAQAQPHPPRPASSMSLSCREMHTQTPYAAQPQPQIIPIESYRPLPPDSARSSRAPTPQLGAFSRLGLEGIGGVAARRERAGSVDSGPLRSAAELFLASSMPKQTASEKVLAAISEWGHHVSDRLAQVMLENKSLRDQLHELQTGQRALATKQEVTEEITAQLSPALHEFFQSLHEKMDQVFTSTPNKTADLVEGKNRHLLMEWKEVTSQRSQDEESGQKPLASLMNHLISKLDDVSTISTYLQAYKDLPQALSDVQVFKVALEALMGKVPHLASAQTAQPTAPLQLQAGSGEDSSSKMLESLESVRAGVDELRQKVGTARGDLGGDMAQVLEVLEQIKGLIPTSGLEAAPIGVAIAPEHDGQTIHTLIDMLGNLSRDVGEIRTQLSQQVMLPFPVPGYDPNYAPQPTPTQADEPALATPSGANHFVGLPTPVTSGTDFHGKLSLNLTGPNPGPVSNDVFGPITTIPQSSTAPYPLPPAWTDGATTPSLHARFPVTPLYPDAHVHAQTTEQLPEQQQQEPFDDPLAFLDQADSDVPVAKGKGRKKTPLKRTATSTPAGPRRQPSKRSKIKQSPAPPAGLPENPHVTRAAAARVGEGDPIVVDSSGSRHGSGGSGTTNETGSGSGSGSGSGIGGVGVGASQIRRSPRRRSETGGGGEETQPQTQTQKSEFSQTGWQGGDDVGGGGGYGSYEYADSFPPRVRVGGLSDPLRPS